MLGLIKAATVGEENDLVIIRLFGTDRLPDEGIAKQEPIKLQLPSSGLPDHIDLLKSRSN